MGQNKNNELATELAIIRREIITHCEALPQIIRTHGQNSLGSVTLAIGKCLGWVGPRVDSFNLVPPLPGVPPLPRVSDLGEQLRVLGLEILHNPTQGELLNTVYTLRKQVDLLNRLATLQAEGAR
jgi:hypothetical protein